MPVLQRLHDFFTKPVAPAPVQDLYRSCVEQARRVAFYQQFAVPDTVDGRFDLLLLHVFLVMNRLSSRPDLKQQLFDLMFADMDRSLREMGVGDMSISRKIKPMISAFYGRGQAYHKALNDGDDSLTATLGRNLYGAIQVSPEILQQLTNYVRRTVASLDRQSIEDIFSGKIIFEAVIE